jgi:hypothetical protein
MRNEVTHSKVNAESTGESRWYRVLQARRRARNDPRGRQRR